MAAQTTNQFGETVSVRWDDGSVKYIVNAEAEATAFSLASESGLQVEDLSDGRRMIAYFASDGTISRKFSSNGVTYA